MWLSLYGESARCRGARRRTGPLCRSYQQAKYCTESLEEEGIAPARRDTRDMTWGGVFHELGLVIASRAELRACGASSAMLTGAVRGGHLIRVRRDHYALPQTDRHVLRAVRVGGRLGCVSALRSLGIFGFDHRATHIHLPRELSRPRSPHDRRRPLTSQNRQDAVLHWQELTDPFAVVEYRVGVIDALRQVLRCNEPVHALASIENALFLGVISEADLGVIFSGLPQECLAVKQRINPKSEAGQETVLRCALEDAGIHSEIQVDIPFVGRVDGLIDGRLIWEADSRLAHDGWELHVRDRDRDIDAARQGYMTLRPAYNRTMFATGDVVEAVIHLLDSTRRGAS